jgi:hypothetical protein
MNNKEHEAPTGSSIACVELIVWKSGKEQILGSQVACKQALKLN